MVTDSVHNIVAMLTLGATQQLEARDNIFSTGYFEPRSTLT